MCPKDPAPLNGPKDPAPGYGIPDPQHGGTPCVPLWTDKGLENFFGHFQEGV